MFSLVADYGNSEEESSEKSNSAEDSDHCENVAEPALRQSDQTALPSASLMLANDKTIPGGVFSNPFREAEDAKIASLEKHVKMVDPENKCSEQKRKICWSYRKGRCRFGSKCNFAHDSDLIVKKELHGNHTHSESVDQLSHDVGHSSMAVENQTVRKHDNRKKRPGLSRDLVPPKKVLKMYHRGKYSGKP
ncbi:uncharacterized protein LOC131689241 isoform X2 [Topomyia yanbarensis]|uniref:uncharacterized protein LOC131689241 isoform X2 n=1 Tax=Topomyia yanbarensis TaxID=2498891 RepID=UPI00273B6EAD|nr:uncharacterized protein LOC131689241 isoform X2 [Topomyia yanbarensis]